MGISVKQGEFVKTSKLKDLKSGDTFTFTDGKAPFLFMDEKTPSEMYMTVELESGIIGRFEGHHDVILRNYILDEVS